MPRNKARNRLSAKGWAGLPLHFALLLHCNPDLLLTQKGQGKDQQKQLCWA